LRYKNKPILLKIDLMGIFKRNKLLWLLNFLALFVYGNNSVGGNAAKNNNPNIFGTITSLSLPVTNGEQMMGDSYTIDIKVGIPLEKDTVEAKTAHSPFRTFLVNQTELKDTNVVSLPNIFGNAMVLQQNTKVPIWGWAPPATQIKITASWGEEVSLITGSKGKWTCKIQTPAAHPGEAPQYTLTVQGPKNKITFSNVLIGEVWICTGQSNMWMPMAYSYSGMQGVVDYEREIAAADYPNIRLFTVPKASSSKPLDNCDGTWEPCSPSSVSTFSAAGYYFGRELYKNKGVNVPVGLIKDSYGGSSVQAWTKQEVMEADPDLKTKYIDQTFKSESTNASLLYNAMIAPIIPYAIKGAIWYQGESNVFDGPIYTKINLAMLHDWRADWGIDFSFYAVQLTPRMSSPKDFDSDYRKCLFREAQTNILSDHKTGIVVTTDLMLNREELTSIHPRNKKDVGIRLAYWALANDYGQKVQYLGPQYQSNKLEGSTIRIHFVPESLGTGITTKDGFAVKCFLMAGNDQKFYPAKAEIDGGSIVVSSKYVNQPVAVRYAFSGGAMTNLMNREGIAAFPFRTDSWDSATYAKISESE
jgi:sialate O-acetylesterase